MSESDVGLYEIDFDSLQIPFNRNTGYHRQRIHRLGQTCTASGEHQRRNFRGPVRRPGRGTGNQHG